MVIQELKPSKRVQGRWLAVLEDGSILRLGENEIIDFALCAGKELTEEEAEGLMASLHRSGRKEKALSLLARKPQSRKELERKLSQWEATQEEAAAKVAISAADNVVTITRGFDVNRTGKVDVNDAQLVYDMYNGTYSDFTQVSVEKFLRADVNGTKTVDHTDAVAIVNQFK